MLRVLITGGAGFIGSNLSQQLVRAGHRVTIFDNLSRHGTAHNLQWLRETLADNVQFIHGDVRDYEAIARAVRGQEVVYHLAGQVAVTASVIDPRADFEVNALGTFNTLEAARATGNNLIFIYTSTNKVYGGMETEPIIKAEHGYQFERLIFGVPETFPLDFYSPYGCSKGTGDQYVRDYNRIYGLPIVVFRLSCIYGPRQFGVEDQGWLAHFIIQAALGRPITIYGNGQQVRDVLFVDDLIRALDLSTTHIEKTRGQIYNIGGGPEYALSIWAQVGPILEELAGRPIQVEYGPWRPGDQRVYVSDIRKATADFGWKPVTPPLEGINRLWEWVNENRNLFS